MISIMALRAVLVAALASVQGLSVVSAGDRTHVLIEVDGSVTYTHELLATPPRIVVDITGADFDLPQRRFLDINRGGVLALRSSQFQAGVVRVVVDLAQTVDYRVEETGGALRISFANPAGAFETWTSGTATAAAPREREPIGDPLRGAPQPADRARTEVPVSRPAVVEAPPAPQQQQIWVEFRNTPIVDVLGTFADFSGRSIIPGQGVQTQAITATIQGQPWDEAMRAILQGQGLAAQELQSGIIMVTSLQQQRQYEEQEETVTEAFPLLYVSADSVAPQVRQLLTQEGGPGGGGTVAINRATNAIIVSARQSVVDRLRALMVSLDQRTPQVTVQVRILSMRRSDFEGLGIHYEFKDRGGNQLNRLTPGFIDANGNEEFDAGEEQVDPVSEVVSLGGGSVAAVGNAASRIPGATFEVLSSLILGRHTLLTWLEAVQRLELAELQADPVVTVLDHRTARVHVGERTPIRVVDQGAASAQGPQAQVRTEETGVILELTPHVVGDQVLLQLHAERSLIENFTVDAGYIFGTSETDTEILLDDAETAVISGLTTTDITITREGVPILMNIPLIGALFRNSFTTQTKEDLLIMVTPYIDRAGG